MKGGDYFVGPAIIVDDKIDNPTAGMTAVIEQLGSVGIPVLKRIDLPDDAEVRHWTGFSLIILDWELVSVGEPGVAVPPGLIEENASRVSAFVSKLLTEHYCPIFILSSYDVEEIRDELARRLEVQEHQISARVLVRSKSDVADDLISLLEDWVNSQPAVYVLKSWECGYRDARRQMFSDFELGSGDWPRVLWKASEDDKVSPHFELSEAISRNILHRFEPLVFDTSVLQAEVVEPSPASVVRSVIHRSAVVPAESLHRDVLMPGDFFAIPGTQDLLINVTPACDLVSRPKPAIASTEGTVGGSAAPAADTETSSDVTPTHISMDHVGTSETGPPDVAVAGSEIAVEMPASSTASVLMTVLRASPLEADAYSSKTKRDALRKKPDPTTEIIWVLSEEGKPYCVYFKKRYEVESADYLPHRLGRLLEPYIIQLQQRFALHFHRQGLPRLPEQFYDG